MGKGRRGGGGGKENLKEKHFQIANFFLLEDKDMATTGGLTPYKYFTSFDCDFYEIKLAVLYIIV